MEMSNLRVEDGHFIFDDRYCYGKKYILLPSGTDKKGRQTFTAHELFDRLPYNTGGWKPINATTAPAGYQWYSNCKSRFDPEYRIELLKVKGD